MSEHHHHHHHPTHELTPQQQIIFELSERIVKAQKPIQILNAIKWDPHVQHFFFKNRFKKLPPITMDYYHRDPLTFEPTEKIREFIGIERDVQKFLGQFSGLGHIMLRICQEYRLTVQLLMRRGTKDFTPISQQLYGSAQDAFYVGGPSLNDLAITLSHTLEQIQCSLDTPMDEKKYDSAEVVKILEGRLDHYFSHASTPPKIKVDDGIIADAAAGADTIKIRRNAMFSERDIKILEVHEGWVHIGTTLNGLQQSTCTFLSKGPPSTTIFQEGLAVILEIFSFASHPNRLKKLTNRVRAIQMAEQGANFIEVFNFFRSQNYEEETSYHQTVRIFRGSTPTGGPFTKDLAYNKGFILIYNYIRLAIGAGKTSRIPLLFLGKINLEDLHIYEDLLVEKIIDAPKFLPQHFKDIAGLSAWMAYSLFLNQLDLAKLKIDYKAIL